jgi:mannose-1-phosphate guanylyltransferase/mannose-6-phosphate isomerase
LAAIYPVILCGGSGTRLWPASRADRPKQFLKLIGDRSSFQDTILRVMDLPGAGEIVVVTGQAMAELVERQALELGANVTVIIEPEARDSAPAIAAAAAYVESVSPDGVMLMLAADHHIAEPEMFREAALVAIEASMTGLIVTFGVLPTSPATGFGYIKPGAALPGGVKAVAAFVEKPDLAAAKAYIADGYYWNSGNFAFTARTLLDELAVFEPAIRDGAIGSVRPTDGAMACGCTSTERRSRRPPRSRSTTRSWSAPAAPPWRRPPSPGPTWAPGTRSGKPRSATPRATPPAATST